MKVLTQLHNYKQIKKHFEQCNCFMFFRGGDYWTSSVLLVEHFVVAPWAGKLTFAISTAFNDQSQRHSFSRLDLPLLSVPLGCKKPLWLSLCVESHSIVPNKYMIKYNVGAQCCFRGEHELKKKKTKTWILVANSSWCWGQSAGHTVAYSRVSWGYKAIKNLETTAT